MSKSRGWGDSPPRQLKKRVYDLIYIRPGPALDLSILSPCWTGLVTHWVPGESGESGRTVLCEQCSQDRCCARQLRQQWNLYFGVRVNSSGRKAVLSLTDLGRESLEAAIPNDQEFRGARIWAQRATMHPSSAVIITSHQQRSPAPLPVAIDIWPTLRAVYGEHAVTRALDRLSKMERQT